MSAEYQPAGLLRDLIAIPSVSTQSNLPVIEYAKQWLAPAGWEFIEQPYTDENGVAKANLIAYRPPFQAAQELALVCHMDTVPFDWPEATQAIERNGNIHGRGACDVKGYLACALAAIRDLTGSICLMLTADEEIGCIGARRLVESGAVRPRYAIIGEPTGLRPAEAGKGYCLAELTVRGREAHSAFPGKGESAIYKAARIIGQVEALARDLEADADARFDPPFTTVNIGTIHGGRAKNVVAGEVRMLLEWRPIPGQRAERVAEAVTCCDVELLRVQPGFATPPDSRVLAELVRQSGNSAVAVSFGTEAPWIAKMGAECVVFGPGDMRVAHSRDEHVAIGDLEKCVEVLRGMWRAFE